MIQMTGKQLLRMLQKEFGCRVLRQKGSHGVVACGTCKATVAMHAGETIPVGTLRKIERDLTPCLGDGWLRRR